MLNVSEYRRNLKYLHCGNAANVGTYLHCHPSRHQTRSLRSSAPANRYHSLSGYRTRRPSARRWRHHALAACRPRSTGEGSPQRGGTGRGGQTAGSIWRPQNDTPTNQHGLTQMGRQPRLTYLHSFPLNQGLAPGRRNNIALRRTPKALAHSLSLRTHTAPHPTPNSRLVRIPPESGHRRAGAADATDLQPIRERGSKPLPRSPLATPPTSRPMKVSWRVTAGSSLCAGETGPRRGTGNGPNPMQNRRAAVGRLAVRLVTAADGRQKW